MPKPQVSSFRADVTVPLGHPLCGGWIKPAEKVTEPLCALGVVIYGDQDPLVLCAVDWTGICNDAHLFWRERLAQAAHTTPERVAVHTVHQHNAPFADLSAQKLVSEQEGLASIVDVKWHEQTVQRVADAIRTAMSNGQSLTHVGIGQAKVDKVASNRRILGPDGKIKHWRASACKDEKIRAEPEGLIDPMLKTVSFWNGDKKLAVLHYYATHPMSYYGDGAVTSDFVGIARERRTRDDGALHIYFTGCAGNIAAGKYNDGSRETRLVLAERMHAAMVESEKGTRRIAVGDLRWRTRPVILPPRSDVSEADLLRVIRDASQVTSTRNRAAMKLSYRRRAQAKVPIMLTSLHLGKEICLLHLPAEAFVEFQLFAQAQRPDAFIATAAYGDDGPWYIPLAKSYEEGGYEPSASFVDPQSEDALKREISALLK